MQNRGVFSLAQGQYSNTNISGIQYGKVSAAEKNLEAVRNFPKEL
jgi:hypothetical protein